jgi:hypothetical protein
MLPKVYSRGIKALKYLSPAIPQRQALLLIIDKTIMGIEATFLKTLAFFSFQSSYAVIRSKDIRPFGRLPLAPEIVHHHSLRVPKMAHESVSKSKRPSQSFMPLLEKSLPVAHLICIPVAHIYCAAGTTTLVKNYP